LTGAIYTLLNSSAIIHQGGEFSRTDLAELLEDKQRYPIQWHEFILDMMKEPELGLCFRLPGVEPERYLLPEALHTKSPDFGPDPEDSLRFRFEYGLLQRGLIPQFIVQAHRNLTQEPTRWRTGVVLEAVGCRVLVRGDLGRRRIDILVTGTGQRRSALNIVLNDLEKVHNRNREIEAKAVVPLPDQPEVSVSYEHLLKLEARYDLNHSFDPDGANRAYTVKELLEGVRREPTMPKDHDDNRKLPTMHAGNNIIVVQGSIQSGQDTNIGSNTTQTTAQPTPPITPLANNPPAVDQPATQPKEQATDTQQVNPPTLAWWKVALGCAIGAITTAIGLILLPSMEWRLLVGLLLGLGILVFVFVLQKDPSKFYRNLILLTLVTSVLTNVTGISINTFTTSSLGTALFQWSGATSTVSVVVCGALIALFVWADLREKRLT
jgi:hypothetical protein